MLWIDLLRNMSDKSDSIRVIKGVDRFKSASSVDYTINTELVQSQNQYTESDRTVALCPLHILSYISLSYLV